MGPEEGWILSDDRETVWPAKTWAEHGTPISAVWQGWDDLGYERQLIGRAVLLGRDGDMIHASFGASGWCRFAPSTRFRLSPADGRQAGSGERELVVDSRPATLLHSLRVGALMVEIIQEAMGRAVRHDLSKTQPPEVAAFDRATPRLATMVYGTPEYEASLDDLRPALEHHYANNRHHPEHHERGISGMTLVDLVEMLADWRASVERMAAGDLRRSIEVNRERFGMSDQLAEILLNTAVHLGWVESEAGGR